MSAESPETVADLMREIDRAYDAFDLMAVCHGWYGVSGLNTDAEQLIQAEQWRREPMGDEHLTEFVIAVVAAVSNETASIPGEILLPRAWMHGLAGLPGLDPGSGMMRHTSHFETYRDSFGREIGFMGRAHPLVLRSVRCGCDLPGKVAVARGDRLGLLLSFVAEIAVSNRILFRQVIAVMASPDGPPTELQQWMALGAPERVTLAEQVWDGSFASWATPAIADAEVLASGIASAKRDALAGKYAKLRDNEISRLRRWSCLQANRFCGVIVGTTGDLFGDPAPGSPVRDQEDPKARLTAFAANPELSKSKRREANDVLGILRATEPSDAKPGLTVLRPIGMLMLVP